MNDLISIVSDDAGQRGMSMPMYLFWRGTSLWCRYPLPGYPERFSLEIYTTGSPTDRKRCEKLGEQILAGLRTKAAEGRLFEKKLVERTYNPTYRRIARRYFINKLRHSVSGMNERYHLLHSYRFFGFRLAREITRDDVENWRQRMIRDGAAVNTVNLRYSYMGAVFHWANSESRYDRRLNYDPTAGMTKLPRAKVRTFVLTEELFERNYQFFLKGKLVPADRRRKHGSYYDVYPNPRFAMFYLALWETSRRPLEVAQYRWEWIHEVPLESGIVRTIAVPPEITKTDTGDMVPLSDRLWGEISQLAYRHGVIFRNREGAPWRNWERLKAALESEFGETAGWIRDCRRGSITHRCEVLGIDPRTVMEISGHRSMAVFNRYRISSFSNVVAAVNKRSRTFGAHLEKTA